MVERDCLLKPECGFKDNFLGFFEIISGDELLVGEIVIYVLFWRLFGVLLPEVFFEEVFDLVKILSERPSINSPIKLQSSSSSVSALAFGQSVDSKVCKAGWSIISMMPSGSSTEKI